MIAILVAKDKDRKILKDDWCFGWLHYDDKQYFWNPFGSANDMAIVGGNIKELFKEMQEQYECYVSDKPLSRMKLCDMPFDFKKMAIK